MQKAEHHHEKEHDSDNIANNSFKKRRVNQPQTPVLSGIIPVKDE